MSVELPKTDRNVFDSGSPGGAVAYSPLREMLGYDPFKRFFTNVDPQIDVIRTESGFDVEIPVAGFTTDQIDLVIKENILTVTGKSERRAFTRSLRLPEEIDTQTIDAGVENGLLTLTLKRHPNAEPRKIEIKSRGQG